MFFGSCSSEAAFTPYFALTEHDRGRLSFLAKIDIVNAGSRLPDGVSLPHIGWNRLHDEREHPLLAGVPAGSYFYFVHSFAPLEAGDGSPRRGANVIPCLARATHGATFAAVAGRGRVLGTQFHPEKSGHAGLTLLKNYLEMSHAVDSGD